MPNQANSGKIQRVWQAIYAAFTAFLAVPTLLILGFLALAISMYALDQTSPALLGPLRAFLRAHAFRSGSATSTLLTTVATGLITISSITFSLLLLAIQQSASNLTSQVFAQFLRRTINQVYLGYFVGLTLYTLIILVTVNRPHNPILGATLDIVFTVIALYLLILLLYSTINQIRPSQVVESIHDLTLRARQSQLPLIQRTRRSSQSPHPVRATFHAPRYGYLIKVHLKPIEQALQGTDTEVELLDPIGHFFAFHDQIALIRARNAEEADAARRALSSALEIQPSRNLQGDPSFGVDELLVIAWTAISTAKQNLEPGQLVIRLLRDLLAHWVDEDPSSNAAIAVVYPDRLYSQTLDAMEALCSITSLSHQFQIVAETMRSLAFLLPSFPADLQTQSEQIILRLLPVAGTQFPAAELNQSLCLLAHTLRECGKHDTAHKVEKAAKTLGQKIGQTSRGTP